MVNRTISIYIHFPWCIKKCNYCDFNSFALTTNYRENINTYVQKIIEDFNYTIEKIFPDYVGCKLLSIFFGGGTPSLLDPQAIAKILKHINSKFTFASDLEVTLEMNPGSNQHKIKNYKLAGITRISLGVQSFQDEKLKILGRIHNSTQAKKNIEQIINANFKSFNLDLMYKLPQQSVLDALYDLTTALSFTPNHISWYQLTIEPHTTFALTPPICPDDDTNSKIYDQGLNLLKKNHYINYEISAFAKKGCHCKHNLNYWKYGDYLGIGPGSHTKLTKFKLTQNFPAVEKIMRIVKIKSPAKYLKYHSKKLVSQKMILSKQEIIFEFMLNRLRLMHSLTNFDFFHKTGYTFKDLQEPLQHASAKKLLQQYHSNSIKTTKLGRRFLTDLQTLFLN